MNEADKATAPSSAATDRDWAENLCYKCGQPRSAHAMHNLTPICPIKTDTPAPLPAGLAKPIQAADDPRHKQHGTFLVRSEVSQALKKIIHNAVCGDPNQTTKPGKCDLAPDQLQALDEICGKISRICCGDPNDPEHWDDGAGYFKLVADRLKGVVR